MEGKMKNKTVKILAISFVLLLFGIFVFLFVSCVISYNEYDLDYAELKYAELTFKSYKKVETAKSSWYEIYFAEYEKTFRIDSISHKGVDREALDELGNYDKVKVYYRDNSSKKYDYEICEMQSCAGVIFSLSDYIKYNRNNQILGMILCAVFAFGVLFCAWTYPRSITPPKTKKKSKKKSNKANAESQKAKKIVLPAKEVFGIIALAYFHRYGWLAVIFVLVLIFQETFYVFAASMIGYAVWTFVGYKCRWRHIFCSYQNAGHRKMTPERIDWDSMKKYDAYGLPVVFLVLGLMCLCAAILT